MIKQYCNENISKGEIKLKKLVKISILFLIIFATFSINVFADYEIGDINSSEDPLNSRFSVEVNENVKDGIMTMSALPNKQENIDSLIARFETGTAAIGIDVSAWQKDIDWAQVANSGVKFAILRCGYRGTSQGQLFEDPYFKKNIQGALNNGIYVGVYFYSTAINEQEALEEANMVLDLIRGYDIKYFVAYDFEDFTPKGNRTDNLPLEQINKNAKTFLSKIRENGYTACLYGSASFFTSYWNMNEFSDYDVWTAHYYVNSPNCERYNIWQQTDSGRLAGIDGDVDIDVDYTYFFKYNYIDITPYMFNAEFYADCNPDLKKIFGYDEVKLKEHYESLGKREGRIATPVFDPYYYINSNSDLKAAFGDDYEKAYNHFVNCGANEKRRGSKYFDIKYYLSNNQDLLKAFYNSGTKALAHYVTNGINENRLGSEDFNVNTYRRTVDGFHKYHLKYNDTLKFIALDVGGEPVILEDIDITPYMFDATYYYNRYTDLQEIIGMNPEALKEHYENCGMKEGRSASRIFDPLFYASANPDIAQAYGTDYVGMYYHFINNGAKEGRNSSEEFQIGKYLENYEDVRNAFGTCYTRVYEHYVVCGVNEGRKGN